MKGHKHLTIVIKLGMGVLGTAKCINANNPETLGTSSIVDEKYHQPLTSTLALIVETAVKLRRDGHRVVIVSSGAIGMAMGIMDVEKRPKDLPSIQVR